MIIEKTENGIYKMLDLSGLPTKMWTGKEVVDWRGSIGCEVPFHYDFMKGSLYIKDIVVKNGKTYLMIKYENSITECLPDRLREIGIKKILGYSYVNHPNKYHSGEIIEGKESSFEVIDSYYKEQKEIKKRRKFVNLKCLKCQHKFERVETSVKRASQCPICFNRKIMVGVNDVLTTHPWVVKYADEPRELQGKTYGNNTKLKWKCPNCRACQTRTVNNITYFGFSCSCQTASRGERITEAILSENKIQYKKQFRINEGNRRYDFFISEQRLVIEVHGLQHYQETNFFNVSLPEQKRIDDEKKILAESAGYSYLAIDSTKGVENLLQQLRQIEGVEKLVLNGSPIVNEINTITKLYNEEKTFREIDSIMRISKSHRNQLLKKAESLGAISLTNKSRLKRQSRPFRKRVVCLNTNEIFNSLKQASDWVEIRYEGITKVAKNRQKTAGKHPVTGEPLKWMYYEDYVEKYGTEGLTEYIEDEIHSEADDLKVSS